MAILRIGRRLVPALAFVFGVSTVGAAQSSAPVQGGNPTKTVPTSVGQGQSGSHAPAGHGPHGNANLPIGTRTTGVWLDDASVLDPGSSSLAVSWDRWTSPLGTQQYFPTASISIGLSERVQAQATVPYMYGGTGQAFSSANFGDMYAGAKVAVAGLSGPVGIAVIPTLEILGSQYANESSRVHFVLPVSLEVRKDPVRLYATAGYFSRGSVFAGGAIEGQVTSRLSLVATLTETKPVGSAQLLSDGTTAAAQLDVGGGAYVSVTDRFTVFASAGRTLSELQADSTKSLFSVGVAITLSKGRSATPHTN